MEKRKNNIINIAIDCMGGDDAPGIIIQGLGLVISNLNIEQEIHFFLYGEKIKIEPLLHSYANIKQYSTIVDTKIAIMPIDQPSIALRRRRGSSMHMAIEAVSNNTADCAVSAGNTGALMAIARFTLGTLPNVNRPAIVTSLPSSNHEMVILDLGANVDCDAPTLYQFALMGESFVKAVFNKKNPTIALLNVGTEEVKGTSTVKDAHDLLKKSHSNFIGYIEADQMFIKGEADVVVTDGFCGNILLKTTEGIYKTLRKSVKEALSSSIIGRIVGIMFKVVVRKSLKRFDPKLRNGAMLIGLNGIVIKSHGSADAQSFSHAIFVAINAVRNKINNQINEGISSGKV